MSGLGPAQDQPSPPPVSSGPLPNLGDYLGRGFSVWGQRWQEWLVPMLVCAVVAFVAYLCCLLPYFLVAGPLACGLYACAIRTLRGQSFVSGTLWEGWDVAGRAILAHIVVNLAVALPVLFLYGIAMGGFVLFAAILDSRGPAGPSEEAAALGVAVVMISMVVFVAGGLIAAIGSLWLSTKTMFIMPLIADRRVDFATAWRMSWGETRNHFWELLLLKLVAGLIGSLGVYLCYVGLIWTLPIYFTAIAAAYEHRFPFHAEPAEGIQHTVEIG